MSGYRARFEYRRPSGAVRGSESAFVTVDDAGIRTTRAHCRTTDSGVQRDVIYSVTRQWQPIHAFIRLDVGGVYQASAAFAFHARGAVCDSVGRDGIRLHQDLDLPQGARCFGAHPISCDAWMCAAFDRRGPHRQSVGPMPHSSPLPDGASGPALGLIDLDVELLGQEALTTAAGTFDCEHYRFHFPGTDWTAQEIWVRPQDYLCVRSVFDQMQSSYELVELQPES